MKGYILLLLWLSTSDPTISYDGELLITMIYVREGEHSPMLLFREDPMYEYWKTIGCRQLTMQGQRRMYQLGKWIRERYGDEIPRRYSRGVAYAGTVHTDDTMISISLVLAGLFPPFEDQLFVDGIKWQPIPVHTEPDEDTTFLVSDSNLENMELAVMNLIANTERDSEWLEDLLGVKIESDVNLFAIFDSVIAAKNMNYEGKWTSKETIEVLQELLVRQLQGFAATPELTKWKLEPFFNEIHRRFFKFEMVDNDVDGDEDEDEDEDDECGCGYNYKVVLFAGNLEMMIGMLHGAKVVGLFDIPEQMPDFGDALMFELREGKHGNRYVNVFYKNSAGEVRQYPIIDCGLDCDSRIFLNKISTILNNELDFPEMFEQPMKELRRFKRTAEISNVTLPYDIFTEPNQFIE